MSGIKMIVGLGNIGQKYQETRHNLGQMYLNDLAASQGLAWSSHASGVTYTKFLSQGAGVFLVKTNTYMNLSGLPLKRFSDYFQIADSAILVAHDELDIPCGSLRLKQGGGHGGHRGVMDMHVHGLKSSWRLRMGIGRPSHNQDVSSWVLGHPAVAEAQAWSSMIQLAIDATPDLILGNFQDIMSDWHTRS